MRFISRITGFGANVRAARFARLAWVLGGSAVLFICGSCFWLLALCSFAQVMVDGMAKFR